MTASASRWLCAALLTGVALALPACQYNGGGNFSVAGYSTGGNFDRQYKTVRVPIFENETFYRGMEFILTQAVIDEINRSTPYRVDNNCQADLELTGTITQVVKRITNVNPNNEVRSADIDMTVAITLRDLRTGEVLSSPAKKAQGPQPGELLSYGTDPAEVIPGMRPNLLVPPAPPGVAEVPVPLDGPPPPGVKVPLPRVFVRSTTNYVPELGESNASTYEKNCQRMARQIVHMMEKPW